MSKLDDVVQTADAPLQTLKRAVCQELRCAMPGIVQSFDASTQTAVIQPAIRDRMRGGGFEDMPLLLDVPVFFPGGAGGGITFPVQAGDECLVIFADTCIDAWLQNGGVQNPVMPRRHDLSDAFAFVGFRSSRNRLAEFKDSPSFFGQEGGSGAPGAAGKSAYQVAVDNGFSGTETEWLLSLKGDKGDPGAQGAQGIPGTPGAKGDKGDPGAPGLTTKVNGVTQVNGEITLPASKIPMDGGGNVQTAIVNCQMKTLWTGTWSSGSITLNEAVGNFRLLVIGNSASSFTVRPTENAQGRINSLWLNADTWHDVSSRFIFGVSGTTLTMKTSRKYLNGEYLGAGDALGFVYGIR